MTSTAQTVIEAIRSEADPKRAQKSIRFFKTGPGEYAEGDVFWGISNPQARTIAQQFSQINRRDLALLMDHQVHEVRLVALIILVNQYKKAKTQQDKKDIFEFYIASFNRINNWDLVDISTHHIVGDYCYHYPSNLLSQWIESPHLWTRRIAVVACLYFIRKNRFEQVLDFCVRLKKDPEPLMHKACGWMLREVGKKNMETLRQFLSQWGSQLPRVTLRYAIERFPEPERLAILKQTRINSTDRLNL